MEPIERIKLILNKEIKRTFSGPVRSRGFLCLHTQEAVQEIKYWFPGVDIDKVKKITAEEIYIINGRLTTFVGGKTKAARRIIKIC